MSDKLDDLERLARLRDEGKISEAQYEQLKQDLVPQAESMSHTLPPPGWYPDPNGVANRQAYWDGQQWTGHTHDQAQALVTPPNLNAQPKRSGCLWAVIVVIVLVVLAGIAGLVATQLAGQEILETFSEVASGLDANGADPSGGGSDRITLEGQGDGATETFTLSGGSYSIVTEVGNDCYYSFTLRDPVDDSRVDDITSMDQPGSTTVSLHGVDSGTYFVEVITGPAPSCPWSQLWTSS